MRRALVTELKYRMTIPGLLVPIIVITLLNSVRNQLPFLKFKRLLSFQKRARILHSQFSPRQSGQFKIDCAIFLIADRENIRPVDFQGR